MGKVVGRILLGVALAYSAWSVGFLDAPRLVKGLGNLGAFLGEVFPPDFGVTAEATTALLETIQMAFIGTFLGFILSIPLSVLGTRTLFGPSITNIVRVILSAVRTVPALLWAVIFVVAVGLGPLAGSLAVALYSLGYLTKLYYEAFEAVDPEVVEAVRAVGASKLQLIRFAIIPESANSIISQLFFMFEYNVRASSILGFVGAGGVGFLMLGYIQLLEYRKLATIIVLTLVFVFSIDYLSGLFRYRYLPQVGQRPK